MPLVTGFDTHDLCKTVGNLPDQYSWQVMNYRIAVRELAASGTDANPDFRDKNCCASPGKPCAGVTQN